MIFSKALRPLQGIRPSRYLPVSVRHLHNPGSYDSRVFRVSEEVQEAVASGKPVVALETTIYTHGFPYPDNVGLAVYLESVVRQHGGVPATIGVINGVAKVGLDSKELVQLASAAGESETMKVSRRDLPFIAGLGLSGRKIYGGTTISGTMVLAHMAGIDVFGTGGLGGVHRGGQDTMDISADLTELGRTPVTVISSGCKSFLDIGRTLEFLETQGVGVATFADGRTGSIDMPGFWTRDSGVKSPMVVQDEKEAASIIYARRLLQMSSGLFFANPIPEEHSIPKSEIDIAIESAIREAEEKGITGHANTPFILAKIKDLTQGVSIPANRALIESNVARATRVAVELAQLRLDGELSFRNNSFLPAANPIPPSREAPVQSFQNDLGGGKVDILVAGSVAVDLSCDFVTSNVSSNASLTLHTSNPAIIRQSIGGVGHNVALAAHLASGGSTVRLCTVVADDLAGNLIVATLKDRGMDTSGIKTLQTSSETRTAQYVAVNDGKKDLHVAMADMNIIDAPQDFASVWHPLLTVAQPKWVVVDGNWNASTISKWSTAAKAAGAKVAFEPVSVEKSRRLFPALSSSDSTPSPPTFPNHIADLATPNKDELSSLHKAAKSGGYLDSHSWWEVIDALGIPSSGARDRFVELVGKKLADEGLPQMSVQLLPLIPAMVVKLGPEGVLITLLLQRDDWRLTSPKTAPYILSRNANGSETVGGVYMRRFPAAQKVPSEDVVSVNGVGDTFLGVLIAGLAKGIELDADLLWVAQKGAVETLRSAEAVGDGVKALSVELEGLLSKR